MRSSLFALILFGAALPALADSSSARYRVSGVALGAGTLEASGLTTWYELDAAVGTGITGSARGPSGLGVTFGSSETLESIGSRDTDGDGRIDTTDNCPTVVNADQLDRGGVGAGSLPDGVGDACQCGDVNGDGRVTAVDAVLVQRSLLSPPTSVLARPDLCDVGGAPPSVCTLADALIIRRALLTPATGRIAQACR